MISPKEEEENHGSRGQGRIPEVDCFFAFFAKKESTRYPLKTMIQRLCKLIWKIKDLLRTAKMEWMQAWTLQLD
ncbi:hypothetical protein M0802_012862 [Mischocyttarus mexicanus]|nr:hypothetical protein M0802_012862 [Mischocyttarus mexicanus]